MRPIDPRLLRHAHAARGCLLVTVGGGLATTLLVLAQAVLLAHALAGAVRGIGVAALGSTLVALALVVAARAAAMYSSEAAALRGAAAVKSELRRKLVACALRRGPAWLTRQRDGEITTLATKGLDALDAYFARYLPQLLLAGLVPIAVLATVTAADWLSGLVIAVTLPLVPVFAVLIGLQTKAHTARQWQLLARLGGHFLDVVEGLPTLKVFGRARAEADRIRTVTEEHRVATMAALRVAFLSALVLELVAALATALVAVEVGLRLLAGHIGYETALLVLLLTPEAYLPLRNLGVQFHASVEGTTAAARVLSILDNPEPDTHAPGTAAARPARTPVNCPDLRSHSISLTDVSLGYADRGRPALERVCVVIEPGERIALTGSSGAGKSSLLALLLRFAEPTSGRMAAGGADLSVIPVVEWRRQIAWVPQHPYLFAGTVAENLALGARDAKRLHIEEAAGLAGLDTALPGGLGSWLTERGGNLSAGQRQRIALARALLRDAPLVLLDEPTAHLDPGGAHQILEVVESRLAGRTVVLVTHRPEELASGYRVLNLDHGRLRPATTTPVDLVAGS